MQQHMLDIIMSNLSEIRTRELPVRIFCQHTLAGGKHMFVLSYCILFEQLVPATGMCLHCWHSEEHSLILAIVVECQQDWQAAMLTSVSYFNIFLMNINQFLTFL